MSDETLNSASALEERSRALFRDSVADLDMATRSRLTQARHAALAAAHRPSRRPWVMRLPVLTSAAGVSAAAVLGAALWFGGPSIHHPTVAITADSQLKFEDLDIIATSDESSGDAIDMLQDDLDFYAWADKTADADPTA